MTKIEHEELLDYSDVLIRPKRSTMKSRNDVEIERLFSFKWSKLQWKGVPLIAANMDTTGTFEVYDVLSKYNIVTALHKFYTKDDFLNKGHLDANMFMVSTGISDIDFSRLTEILSVVECNWICIDIANGYLSSLVDFCKKVRLAFPDKILIAGNVATREMVEELLINGQVDIVKVGIGPGSACTTRLKTGVGVPQLSAVLECSDAAHGLGGLITTPLLFGYMVGNLGVSPTTGETVS